MNGETKCLFSELGIYGRSFLCLVSSELACDTVFLKHFSIRWFSLSGLVYGNLGEFFLNQFIKQLIKKIV